LFSARRKQKSKRPQVLWRKYQAQLERAASNVLTLLDACHAGGSTPCWNHDISVGGTTELLAACGVNKTTAGGNGPKVFTNVLLSELKIFAARRTMFSVAELHHGMLAQLASKRVTWREEITRKPTCAPVYIRLRGGTHQPSIMLKALGADHEQTWRSPTRGVEIPSKELKISTVGSERGNIQALQ
jgi:hypothetical protein